MTKAKVGRPSMTEEEKRKNRIFKATDDEWQLIKDYANESGLSASEYIRFRAMRQRIVKKKPRD